jgi:GntR family transcriptional regulator/MocR family aminotransferase
MQAQLTSKLKRVLQSGELQPGERLPSTRDLAKTLMISRNTVIAAYKVLAGEGYLVNEPRSGFRVNQATQAFRTLSVRASASRQRQASPRIPVGPVPFRPTQPDVNLFPLQIWNRHRNRVLKRGLSLLHYQSRFSIGLDELRSQVADYLRDSRGVRCGWQEVAITNGSQQALFLLAHLLLKPGEPVYMEDPGYNGAKRAWQNVGAAIVPTPIDSEGIRLPPTGKFNAKVIYVTPSHQFPLGVCMSLARRLALLEAAREADAWIVEDDYDAEFRYTSAPQPSLQSLDERRRVIYIGSFSKTLFPGLRIGYVVLPPSLVEPFTNLKSIADDYSPLIDQATLAAFLESGGFYAHLRRCRKHYAERQSHFLARVKQYGLPLIFRVVGRGMNLAGFLKEPAKDRDVSVRLHQAGLQVPPLAHYAIMPTRPGLLFGLTAFSRSQIDEGVARIAQVLSSPGASSFFEPVSMRETLSQGPGIGTNEEAYP